MLILTENYAALPILQQRLQSVEDAIVIFGSSFPKDQEYTQVSYNTTTPFLMLFCRGRRKHLFCPNLLKVCRNINRIKVCMETGKTVVLLNLDNLYESLYDALNQVKRISRKSRQSDVSVLTRKNIRAV